MTSEPFQTSAPKAALVVIDMQRALLQAPARALDDDFAVRRACALIDRARREGVQIIFVQHGESTDGWRLIDAQRPRFPDWVIVAAPGSLFEGSNLSAQLKAVGISRLILAGAKADSCLDGSREEAETRGFAVVVAGDAVDAFGPEDMADA